MRWKFSLNYQVMLFALLVALIVAFSLAEPVFSDLDVLFDVTAIVGEIGIMALPMTFIITTGGIDLSVGYILQLSAIVFGAVFASTGSVFLAVSGALLTGTACGLFNGLIISRTRIPPLVTTLATMNLFRGISMIIAGSNTYSGFPDSFKLFSTIMVFDVIPIQFFYLLFFFFVLQILYTKGTLGRTLKGIGFNENALQFSGIKTKHNLLLIYTLCGLMCGFAALVYLGRLPAAKTSMGNDLNLQVITAVVLGGTSIMGGVGSISGTFIGVLIIGVLKKGFSLLNFSGNLFNFTLGMMLIVALIVFAVMERNRTRRGKGVVAEREKESEVLASTTGSG
ncbi:MAG: ABC transporter permease [Propionivibrio sp.]